MSSRFNKAWREWILLNVSRGCDKDEMFRILLDHGFEYNEILQELNHTPTVDLVGAMSPFRLSSSAQPESAGTRLLMPFDSKLFGPATISSDHVELYRIAEFLNEYECNHLIGLIQARHLPSTVTNNREPDPYFRTSKTCDLGSLSDPVIRNTDRRLCRFLGINPSYSEPMQGQLYNVGDQFKPHTDYFESEELHRCAGEKGQRTWTAMIYLNDELRGGETIFPRLAHSVQPKRGMALFWNNLMSDGRPNPYSLHQSMPVREGFKAIITKWFRAHGQGSMLARESNEWLPAYTCAGFHSSAAPLQLLEKLRIFYRQHLAEAVEEEIPEYIKAPQGSPSHLIPLHDGLKREIHRELRECLERWAGVFLEPTYVYGIRRYRRGATLEPHRDRTPTHIVSVILNIEQQVEKPWALVIEDHLCRVHEVLISPGEMLFYEGGRLLHGRPYPLEGESYANVFVHYRPLTNDCGFQ